MLKALLKLVSGVIVLGTSVLFVVGPTGAAGDALAETFGGAGDEKAQDGAVNPQGELISPPPNQGPRVARRAAPSVLREGDSDVM